MLLRVLLVLLILCTSIVAVADGKLESLSLRQDRIFKERLAEYYDNLTKKRFDKIWNMAEPNFKIFNARDDYAKGLTQAFSPFTLSYNYLGAGTLRAGGYYYAISMTSLKAMPLRVGDEEFKEFKECDGINWIWLEDNWYWTSHFNCSWLLPNITQPR